MDDGRWIIHYLICNTQHNRQPRCPMQPLKPVSLENIRAARERIAGAAIRTPLVRLNVDDASSLRSGDIFLKLENLQPIGSFKLRGASNAMQLAGEVGAVREP